MNWYQTPVGSLFFFIASVQKRAEKIVCIPGIRVTFESLHSKQVFQVPPPMMDLPSWGAFFLGRMELSPLEWRLCRDPGWGCSNERQTYQMGGADEPNTNGGSQGGNYWGSQRAVTWIWRFLSIWIWEDAIFIPFPFLSMGNLYFFWFIFMCEMLCKGLNLDPNGQRGRYQENISELSFMVVSKKSRMYVSWRLKNFRKDALLGRGTIPFWQVGIARLKVV